MSKQKKKYLSVEEEYNKNNSLFEDKKDSRKKEKNKARNRNKNKTVEIELTGNYLKEQELIEKLNLKLNGNDESRHNDSEKNKKDKCDCSDNKKMVRPAIIDAPYPPIKVKEPNLEYAQIISNDFAGIVSEFGAIAQYVNHQIRLNLIAQKASQTLLAISKAEMIHMEMLGKLIIKLGGDVNYCFYNKNSKKCSEWKTEYINYGTNYINMILMDINDEYKAIKQYEEHIKEIKDENIQKILKRIIEDEKYHIELLSGLVRDYNSEN